MVKPYPTEENVIKVPRFEESAGFYTTTQRSKIMSKIKSKNSKPELLLRKALWAKNLRFRLHLKGLPGIKDFRLRLVTLPTASEINEVLDEITEHYKDYAFERTPIELIDYHEKCPL